MCNDQKETFQNFSVVPLWDLRVLRCFKSLDQAKIWGVNLFQIGLSLNHVERVLKNITIQQNLSTKSHSLGARLVSFSVIEYQTCNVEWKIYKDNKG